MNADSFVLNVRGGAQLCVPAALGPLTPYVLVEQEDWFEDEIRFVRRWLRPGMRAVDIGASYGVYSLAIARAVGAAGRLWAFEPTPDTADYLQRNLELNGCQNASLIRAAVSERAGTAAFATDKRSELNSLLAGEPAGEQVEVRTVTLDQAAAEWGEVDFVKLDVEGHELQAIRGGARFFTAGSPLVMLEVWAHGRKDLAALAPLAEMGYRAYRLLPGPLILVPFDPREPMDSYQLNVFACKADRARKLADGGFLAERGTTPPSTPSSDAWWRHARAAPYSRGLATRWFENRAACPEYLEGLAAFAQSRESGRSAAERLAWLEHGFGCVREALGSSDTLSRRLSLARLAWELGARETAVEALQHAGARLEDEAGEAMAEPFVCPSSRYERLENAGREGDWLKCVVVEQFEKLRNFSSLFGGADTLPLLDSIVELPFRSPEIDRRRQLVRWLSGAQGALERVPRLCVGSDENLNPQFWSAR